MNYNKNLWKMIRALRRPYPPPVRGSNTLYFRWLYSPRFTVHYILLSGLFTGTYAKIVFFPFP